MVCWGYELGAVGLWAHMNPLSYGSTPVYLICLMWWQWWSYLNPQKCQFDVNVQTTSALPIFYICDTNRPIVFQQSLPLPIMLYLKANHNEVRQSGKGQLSINFRSTLQQCDQIRPFLILLGDKLNYNYDCECI